jgi:hypothetical protein
MNLTQKISQMTPKGADLDATDLIEVSTIVGGSYVTKSITGQELIDAIPLPPSGLTVGTTPIASGTIGRVLFQGTGNVLQQSSSLFWDSTNNRLGVGTSTPITAVEVKRTGSDSWITASRGNNSFHAGFLFNPNGSWAPSNVLWNFGLYANTNDLRYWTYNGSTDTTVLNLFGTTGNVGINTTTDAGFRLDVNGTARVVNQATIQTLTIGLGNNSIATNTALGFQVLANANASNTGFNTGVGYQSLSSIIGNGYNTAVGYQALKNSTASTNTAVGYQAGLNNSASDNVFIGHQAGLASTNTSSTIAIGAYALLSNTTGTALTAIGRGALENATGGGNVAIGFWAGRTHTTGTNNIFIGNSSTGVSNTDSNRTWIGNSSTTSTWLAGNVLINTTTDAGFKLDVNGTARVATSLVVGGTGSGSLTTSVVRCNFLNTSDNGFSVVQFQTLSGNATFFQSVSIGSGANPLASAQLEVASTTKGFLPPRMTTTQRNAIASPAAGLQVYDTTLNRPCFYDGTTWITL